MAYPAGAVQNGRRVYGFLPQDAVYQAKVLGLRRGQPGRGAHQAFQLPSGGKCPTLHRVGVQNAFRDAVQHPDAGLVVISVPVCDRQRQVDHHLGHRRCCHTLAAKHHHRGRRRRQRLHLCHGGDAGIAQHAVHLKSRKDGPAAGVDLQHQIFSLRGFFQGIPYHLGRKCRDIKKVIEPKVLIRNHITIQLFSHAPPPLLFLCRLSSFQSSRGT